MELKAVKMNLVRGIMFSMVCLGLVATPATAKMQKVPKKIEKEKVENCMTRDVKGNLVWISCEYKVHPMSGEEVVDSKPYQRKYISKKKDLKVVTSPRVVPGEKYPLFKKDGGPNLWYYKHDDGRLEFFTEPGLHARKKIELIPADKYIANILNHYFKNDMLEYVMGADVTYKYFPELHDFQDYLEDQIKE